MDGSDHYGANSPNDLSRVESYDRESYSNRDREPYRDNRRRSPPGEYHPNQSGSKSFGRSDLPPRSVGPVYGDRNRVGMKPLVQHSFRDNSHKRSTPADNVPIKGAANRAARRRSRSPMQVDRYQPDRSRDDYYRGGRDDYRRDRRPASPHGPPHGGPPKNIDRYVPGEDTIPRPIPVNQLRDPLLEPSQVGFSYFSEWWRTEQDIKAQRERQKTGRRVDQAKETREEQRIKIQAAYDQYKLNWNTRMSRMFVHGHKYDTWFRERYVPEVRDPLREKVIEFRKGLYSLWESDIGTGVFDEFTCEGIYKTETNGAGGLVEKEEGEAVAAAEVLAVSDLIPTKGADIRDPVAYQPTLLVKTITPAVSRQKMEEFCREHLGDGDGGFKWLSLSDPNPGKKFHRLGWIMLHPLPESNDESEQRRDGRDDEDGEHDDATMNEDRPNVNLTTCERALAEINNKTIQDPEKGDFTVHVGVHHPQENPRKKALWDLFSAPERVERDLDMATRLVKRLDEEIGADVDGYTKVEDKVNELAGKGYLQPPIVAPSTKKSRANDAEEGEDESMEEGEEEQPAAEDEVDDEELLIKKKKLDLLVEYLRRVHNFCFYCVFECDSVHELQRKCAGGHLRRPRASLTSAAKETARATTNGQPFPLRRHESSSGDVDDGSPVEEKKMPRAYGKNQLQKAYNWVKTFEEKLLQVLEPENVDVKKLGGRRLEEGLEEELAKFVKQEDESKYRCKVPDCPKMFKGVSFWRKHVEKRHAEWFDTVQQDVSIAKRYYGCSPGLISILYRLSLSIATFSTLLVLHKDGTMPVAMATFPSTTTCPLEHLAASI